MQQLIKLKVKRDIGDTITTYFEFFKQNLKNFVNIFIRYNGIFLIGFLGVSYLMVTGFMGSVGGSTMYNEAATDTANLYFGLGIIGFLFLFFCTAILNYSLAASYAITYEAHPTKDVDKKNVWHFIFDRIGSIALFVFLAVSMFVIVFIVGMVLSFIPVLGTFAYYLLQIGFITWMGLSFMAMLYEKRDVINALGEGWTLLFTHFWKAVLVNLVVGILISVLMLVVYMIPGILLGIYLFHSSETGVELEQSAVAKIIFTIAGAIFLMVASFNQSMSQLTNSVLYFSLHEETYNEEARKRIEEIGAGE
ncbi:hypothetical protein ACFQO1_07880 [Jejudonia soesokkakensis]|uniref:Glycerophosphoryl diester phosphodiesterase membrane domain-containing protein n=1 Tax=Jejudonia soesokkakensis TaxID=1323432 RepID=A0ABW2MVQ1_9FLAO